MAERHADPPAFGADGHRQRHAPAAHAEDDRTRREGLKGRHRPAPQLWPREAEASLADPAAMRRSVVFATSTLSHRSHLSERIDMNARTAPWNDVFDFWFPEGRSSQIAAETHRDHWSWRLHGGADDMIVERFADLTRSAASGDLDDWTSDPEGRLALIIVLDQFSRSLWRNTQRAFAQDPAALSLAMEGFSNGHYASPAARWRSR
jgi:hypothetical protein